MRSRVIQKILFRYSDYQRIKELKIEGSGLKEDGVAFITLRDGKQFYGYPSVRWQRILHYLAGFNDLFDSRAFNVAFDIVLRYEVPKQDPLIRGKYYDFKPGDTILEVGAYTGLYAIRASEYIGPSGQVIAVEAVPDNFRILKMNVEKNRVANVKTVSMGIYSKSGQLTFYRQSRQRASFVGGIVKDEEKFEIQVDTLDQLAEDFGLEKVDFVRIQINGGEIHALKGSKRLLDYYRPVFLIATPYGTMGEVVGILHENGYTTSIHGESVLGKPN